jgi:hypothetical protein
MKAHKHLTLVFLAILLLPSLCGARQPADFETRLELLRNGKLTGEMLFKMTTADGRWTMQSETKGTKGLAWFLGLHENSTGEGDWQDGSPRPLRYERNVSAIKHMHWAADFDWARGIVHTVYPDGESDLELQPGVLDESAVGLRIRAGLARGEDEWFLDMVDEEKIEHAHFRVSSVEMLDTALGCMRTHVVEKVRGEGSKRYTRTYYAENHDFAPVLIEHGKQGGDHIEGRVVSLTLDGQPVETAAGCPK